MYVITNKYENDNICYVCDICKSKDSDIHGAPDWTEFIDLAIFFKEKKTARKKAKEFDTFKHFNGNKCKVIKISDKEIEKIKKESIESKKEEIIFFSKTQIEMLQERIIQIENYCDEQLKKEIKKPIIIYEEGYKPIQ